MKTLSFLTFSVWAALAVPALSHEFWLDTENYQVDSGEQVTAKLRNGQNFKGISLAYFDQRIARFDRIFDGDAVPVTARAGDDPAFDARIEGDGLLTLVYQSTPDKISYKEWDKFQSFADHKAFKDVRARHGARGLSEDLIKETYTRYSKALIAVGNGAGKDMSQGLEIEIIALKNPYTDDLSAGLPVQVLYREMPRIAAQVEIFERPPEGDVIVTTLLTDDTGTALIPVKAGHTYLLDNVLLREPSPEQAEATGADWETLWAALTFGVPD